MRTRSTALLALLACLLVATDATAAAPAPGVHRMHFTYGPIVIKPGTNLINIGDKPVPKPAGDGYITRLKPTLTLVDGTTPPTDRIHLHHGVWLNAGSTQYPRSDATAPGVPERFFAAGEEKTIFSIPAPYGYFVRGTDQWILNYMIHDLTNRGAQVYIKYELDFVPAASALGRKMKPASPVWMDVENGSAYPVFDVLEHSGTGGKYTFPDQATSPYAGQAPRNVWTVPRNMTLLGTAGHLHPGGLYDDLRIHRQGAGSRLLFHSQAHYFGNRPPLSWDMAMTATPSSWRVALHQGDTLSVSATYDTSRASWYESMGIMIAWVTDGARGANAFTTKIATRGHVTHGHLAENNHRGGSATTGIADPTKLPNGSAPGGIVPIGGFRYHYGDLHDAGVGAYPPAVAAGQSLTFENKDINANVFHSVTACKAPCNLQTGTSFPIANGPVAFDSGQLGFGPPGFTAAANRDTWQTPTNLTPGTYTYFCRVHPFMRGAFRVVRP
jgi:plastocyanin